MEGKAVVITGAASGLGRQLAFALSRARTRLLLGDRDAVGLEQTAAVIRSHYPEVSFFQLDVTREVECRDFVRVALDSFGRMDFLILCAGISMWARFEQVRDLTLFRHLLEVNYLGSVYCIHAALPSLRQTRGTIVAISSLQGVLGIPNHTGYSASKHALTGFLDALEFELGNEVRILNVMPGWITGTGLRAHAYNADGMVGGRSLRKHSKESVGVQECAEIIIRAMETRTGPLFIPSKLRFLPWLKACAPQLAKRLIRRAVEEQEER